MKLFRSWPGSVAGLLVIGATFGCAHTRPIDNLAMDTRSLRPPLQIQRPLRTSATDFGKMVRAYVFMWNDLVLGIDLMPNNSGVNNEVPIDLAYYAIEVVDAIAAPFRTMRRLPAESLLNTPYGGRFSSEPQSPNAPKPVYTLRGELLRYDERVTKQKALRLDVLAKLKGQGIDVSATDDGTAQLTSVRVGLSLVDTMGVTIPGAAATYELFLLRKERSNGFSAYFEGSGVGIGGKVVTVQDLGDALFDVVAAATIQVLGNALLVPYYRCDSAFTSSEELDLRYRQSLARSTRTELEVEVKRFLFAEGLAVDMSSLTLTGSDRAILAAEMKNQGLSPESLGDLEEFLFQTWKTMDYRKAEQRIQAQINANARSFKEQAELEGGGTTMYSSPELNAASFGWPKGTPCVTMDLTRLGPEMRQSVVQVMGQVRGCAEIRVQGAYCGLKFTGSPGDIQLALLKSNALSKVAFTWKDLSWTSVVAHEAQSIDVDN